MKNYLVILILFLASSCEFSMPNALEIRNCNTSPNISYTVDATNSKKYNFVLNNMKGAYENSQITWRTSSGSLLGSSSSSTFSYTFPSDGNYSVQASFQNLCGSNVTTNSSTFTILKTCVNPTGISVISNTNGKYIFKVVGTTSDIASITWKTISSANVVYSQVTNSNASNYETTLSESGLYTTIADITTSCGIIIRYSVQYNFVKPLVVKDIYICGYEGNFATYWKNGIAYHLTDGNFPSIASSIVVVENDVYVAGYEYNNNFSVRVAKYWKNGVDISLTSGRNDAQATSISLVGSDVYVAGYERILSVNTQFAKFWKNRIGTNLSIGPYGATATSINIYGNDIYVTGYESDGVNNIGKYWKNGIEFRYGTASRFADLKFDGNDIYVLGDDNGSVNYWKNGIANKLQSNTGNPVFANSIEIIDKVIFITGAEKRNQYNVAKYWRNGIGVDLEVVNNENSSCSSISVVGNKIYVVGYQFASGAPFATYWENGRAIKLSTASNSVAYDIFITVN